MAQLDPEAVNLDLITELVVWFIRACAAGSGPGPDWGDRVAGRLDRALGLLQRDAASLGLRRDWLQVRV